MKKNSFRLVFLFSLLGALGAVLRLLYNNRCTDHNGYAPSGMPITAALTATACLSALLALAVSVFLTVRNRPKEALPEMFLPADKTTAFFAHAVSAGMLLLFFLFSLKNYAFLSGVGQFAVVMSLPAALSLLVLLVRLARNKTGKTDTVCFSVIAVFFCFCLLEHFIPNNINPQTLAYCFECAAFGSSVLFCFSRGGYSLNKPQPLSVIFMGLIAICFCLMALTGIQTSRAERFSLLAAFFLIFPNLTAFLRKLSRK